MVGIDKRFTLYFIPKMTFNGLGSGLESFLLCKDMSCDGYLILKVSVPTAFWLKQF